MGTLTVHITDYITERTALGRFNGSTPTNMRHQLSSLNKWHGDRALNRLTTDSILRWMESLTDTCTTGTRSTYLSAVAGFTAWLTAKKLLATDPCAGIDRPRLPRSVPRALPEDRIAACLAACRDDRDRAVIWLGVGMGLRRAEIARARWCDYDDHANMLRIAGKGGHVRLLPVTDEVRGALEKIRGHHAEPIIPRHDRGTGPLSPEMIGRIVRRIATDAGVKHAAFDGVGVHSLRHTAASDVLKQSGDLQAVQQMLGHTNLSTTAIYLRVTAVDDLRRAMQGRKYDKPEPERAPVRRVS